MHQKQRMLLERTIGASSARRRWSTALVSAVALVSVFTPPAMAAAPSATEEASGMAPAPVSDAATGSSDEPGPVPPKILGLEPGQSPDPDAVPDIAPSSTLTSGMLNSWQEAETPTRAERDGAKVPGCAPYTGADYPHRSSTGVAVSAHGWWKKGTCSNGTATVKACLYEYYTDDTWRRKACNTDGNLKPGGGSARRVPVRKNCPSTAMTTWRVHVDVDVNWEIDDGGIRYMTRNVACRKF
ncbi:MULTISPECIES: hypothetical protein [Actinopolyspora]|uniref:Secreted protein n=1 Tax=Actinopolyspora saharensis TaxID=995062 RepID=A0A1H0Z5C3_9ACTN|nr:MULTISPECIES: hypothetical protein [Actinopolyspora]SDQ22574.1 hypothetical protein SAMN04489718_0851 [Actinopolyspora saharensis]